MAERPQGITCDCGAEHPFGDWVHAHWDEPLTLKCDKCGQEWAVRRGIGRRVGRPRKQAANG